MEVPDRAHIGFGIDMANQRVRIVPTRIIALSRILIRNNLSDETVLQYDYDPVTAPNFEWILTNDDDTFQALLAGSLSVVAAGAGETSVAVPLIFGRGQSTYTWPTGLEDWEFSIPEMFEGVTGSFRDGLGGLRMSVTGNTNSFAFFESALHAICTIEGMPDPNIHPSDIPLLGGRADGLGLFVMDADIAANVPQQLAPTLRLRFSPFGFQQSDALVVTSFNEGTLSPGNDQTRRYRHFFSIPSRENLIRMDWDLLNFLSDNATEAEMYLERMQVRAVDTTILTDQREEYSVSFAGGNDQGWTPRIPPVEEFVDPVLMLTEDGLAIRGNTDAPDSQTRTHFAYWGSPEERRDVELQSGRVYRVSATVGSDAPAGRTAELATFRLRINTSNFLLAAFANIESMDSSNRLPFLGQDESYSFYFLAPPEVDGEPLLFSFDYLLVENSDNDPSLSLFIKDLEVESFLMNE